MEPMPWRWYRRLVAKEWHVPPWVVDEAPWEEVEQALALLDIDGEVAQARAHRQARTAR